MSLTATPTADDLHLEGVRLRELQVTGPSGDAALGVLLTPMDAGEPAPVLILGHDLGASRLAPKYVNLGAEYVRREGWAVAILDGPFHGARMPGELRGLPPGPERFALMRAQMARPGRSASMAAEWSTLLDLLTAVEECDVARVGFEAVSMSSMYGVRFVASEPRVRAAVFHCVGVRTGAEAQGAGPELGGAEFAAQVSAMGSRPVQLLAQSEDELFSRESSLRFYDTLSGPVKELIFLPGGHREPPESPGAGREYAAAFLRRHL